ncbi:protoporphyrinogen oxidase [Halolamina sp. CBA1230]|uniref:protoporphyrinogen oxidase n=1 Tax=Halolamina sp. CBA1230 TaxID=1853690 RepID=UPI0009A191E1|nr:protoporphyrinogen oxidase [Halolamina sp. CBA1230]QKY20074.1 protoporphyrinogen oxidase [Halolamina sp. CBA1230]
MRVGIVGAGISGLALHHHLRQRGIDSVVFEADAEPGGVISSRTVDGRVVEDGPQRTRLSPPVASLVEALDIDDRIVEATDAPLYVYRDGTLREVPFSLREGVATDLLSPRGKLRLLLEPLTGPPRGEESVEESLSRMLGDEASKYLVGPLYGGIYGTHPDEMPMRHSLGRALEKRGVGRSLLVAAVRARRRGSTPPVASFDGGLGTLPRALFERHHERVHLGTPVETVRETDDGFAVETPDGTTAVDHVVCTTPADVTAGLLDALAPESAAALRRLSYNPMAAVHLESAADLDAAGFQVQYEEPFRTLGVTCTGTLFDRGHRHTAYLGGGRNPGLVERSEPAIREVAEREFAELAGVETTVVDVHRLRRGMPAYDASWDALDDVNLPAGVHLCANYAARAGIPGRVREAKRLAKTLADA